MIDSFVTLTDAPWKEVVQFAVTLFAILNPAVGASVYLSLAEKKSEDERVHIVRRTMLTVLVLLGTIIWFGNLILDFLGISIAAFRIGGGFIVFLVGMNMMELIHLPNFFSQKNKKADFAVVPLATPIIAGPGVLAITLSEVQNTFDSLIEKVIISIATLLVLWLLWLVLRHALVLSNKLGESGVNMVCKLMGLFLVVVSTQVMLEGLILAFPAWA